MNEIQATAVMIGLFALRCVVPLLITVGLGRVMNRLIERWAAEEEEAQRQRSTGVPAPAPVPPQLAPQPALSLPCWLFFNCDESERVRCAAYRRQGIPCWQARLIEEGKLPADCPTCPRYLAGQPA